MIEKSEAVTVLPQTTDRALCIQSEKPISEAGFAIISTHLDEIIARYGKARLLTYFKSYKGWDKDAVATDMEFTLHYGKKFEKIAFVNPPEKFIFLIKTKGSLVAGEIRYFDEEDLDTALQWIVE